MEVYGKTITGLGPKACETMQQVPCVLKTILWAVLDFRDGYTEQKRNVPQ